MISDDVAIKDELNATDGINDLESDMSEATSNEMPDWAWGLLYITLIPTYGYGLYSTWVNDSFFVFMGSLLFPPLGVIYGFINFF